MQQLATRPAAGTETGRNYGIDALRMLAMFMVVMLHVLGQGGVLQGVGNPVTPQAAVPWLLEAMAYCAVDCYALITGYVCLFSKHKYRRIISLWFQVFFYTAVITIFTAFLKPGTLGKEDVLNAIFPMLRKQYWYFTQYVGLFFLIPFLNKLMLHLKKKEAQGLLGAIFVFLSLLPLLIHEDLLVSAGGYSMIWLAGLYIFGAYIRQYQNDFHFPRWQCLTAYFAGALVVWGGVLLQGAGVLQNSRALLKYTSPFVLLCALSLMLFFLQCPFKKKWAKKAIGFFAPVSFGVFLIHSNGLIFHRDLKGAFTVFRNYPLALTVLFSFLTACAIYLACSLIDFGRLRLFQAIHIDRLSQKIVDLAALLWRKLTALFKRNDVLHP